MKTFMESHGIVKSEKSTNPVITKTLCYYAFKQVWREFILLNDRV